MFSRIAGTGSYLPEKVLTNAELAQQVDTTDEWIVSRTGIRQRHLAAPDQLTSDLALIAVERALAAAGVDKSEVDLLIVATTTPDQIFPST
ncbi:MAG: 3-oxoacyl-ACP synthase, partial [Deefgea sp.]